MNPDQEFSVAVDIGGTFTDLLVFDETGKVTSFKSPTTHADLTEGIFNVLDKCAKSFDLSIREVLSRTSHFVHGTTVATNAIIEGETSDTALITTEGFEDILWLREGGKEDPYDWDLDFPDPLIPRKSTFGVKERIRSDGEVVIPLDPDQVRTQIEKIIEQDVSAVAVSLLWAHENPSHEQRVKELLLEMCPEIYVSVSHEVNPIIREYPRTSSTALDASVSELVTDYLQHLEHDLSRNGFDERPLIITANGGVVYPRQLRSKPVWSVDSGPTMLPTAGLNIVGRELGRENIIALDMGGTSLDIGIVEDGTIPRTRDAEVGNNFKLGIEKVNVRSVGAGGGSIASVDEGGLLHIGPESAGSRPGPACYMRGGQRPTVTDAALILGYLNEENFLGGDMKIDRGRARNAVKDHVADKLGVDEIAASHAIFATTIQDSVSGIEEMTVKRGIDPRNYVMFGGGGALGLFAAFIARELDIDQTILPNEAGVVSSVGGLESDIRRDFSESHMTISSAFDHDGINQVLSNLQDNAEAFLSQAGIPSSDRSLSYFTEARYPDQVWELSVEFPFGQLEQGDEDVLVEKFHQKHAETYGFRTNEDVEFLHWRIEAKGETDHKFSKQRFLSNGPSEPFQEREVFFEGTIFDTPIYRTRDLRAHTEITGPSVIEGENTTIIVPPGSTFAVTDLGNYYLRP